LEFVKFGDNRLRISKDFSKRVTGKCGYGRYYCNKFSFVGRRPVGNLGRKAMSNKTVVDLDPANTH
jgi:hypothetical protein